MPVQANILRIVVASPGDVQAERDVLSEVVDELNRGIMADRNLRFELSRWETDAYPGFHPLGPQGLIDSILRIEDCDILIGIFWRRFGTPTMDAQSGTEHEFRTAYKAWKAKAQPHIMMYFSQKAYTPKSKEDIEQWGKVLEFQKNFSKEGLWWPYKSKSQFEKLVRNHLSALVRSKFTRITIDESPKHKKRGRENTKSEPVHNPSPPATTSENSQAPGTSANLDDEAQALALKKQLEDLLDRAGTLGLGDHKRFQIQDMYTSIDLNAKRLKESRLEARRTGRRTDKEEEERREEILKNTILMAKDLLKGS